MAENLKKKRQGYGYTYADLAETNRHLDSIGWHYYQTVERVGEEDYIITYPIPLKRDDKGQIVRDENGNPTELEALQGRCGCRIVNATLSGKSNPAQEQGSALTYARRYSLWMAFGLATEDDDAQSLTAPKSSSTPKDNEKEKKALQTKLMDYFTRHNMDEAKVNKICELYKVKCINQLSVAQCKHYIEQLEKNGGNINE